MRRIALATAMAALSCGISYAAGPDSAGSAPAAPASGPTQATPAPAESAPAAAPADAQIQHGHAVFQYWCAPCHAPGPLHPGTQALEYKYKGAEPGPLEERKDLTPDVTRYYVRHGVSIMPPFRKTEVNDRDLAALVAYLARPR